MKSRSRFNASLHTSSTVNSNCNGSGVAAKENNITEGQRNDTTFDTASMTDSNDDAVITGFGLTGVTVPSAVSDLQESTSKKMEEVSQSEKDPSLSDDKDQLGQGEEKNRIFTIIFLNEFYVVRGLVSNRMFLCLYF